jgi:isopenicillin N synthase-like dioxygenase
MIERWTNGEWTSTNHRVVHQGSNFRVSVPFFFEPDFDAVVKPLKRCVERTGGKEKFGSAVYGEHLIGKIRGNFY